MKTRKLVYENEEYREIPNFKKYFINKNGKILSKMVKNKIKIMSTHIDRKGYINVGLSKGGKQYQSKVHRLVLEAFRSKCPSGLQACHFNGIKNDKRIENLRWDTPKNNSIDNIRLKKTNCGEKCIFSRLNKFKVQRIRLLKEISPKLSNRKIARLFKVSHSPIGDIINKISWQHII